VGGGSFPGAKLETWLVRLAPSHLPPDTLLTRLRESDPPTIARIDTDRVLLDPRTLLPGDDAAVIRAVRAALDG